MCSIEVIYIDRTKGFIPIVMVITSGELFIVRDEHISEQFGKYYVDTYNLITKYIPLV